uniref:PsbB mRNA maturation factor Mbb1, chloroplastic n=1 Tax=Rhizochromulina marina TaxID=1034831 RepID=A0A7S2SWU7_9STRA|mmetsp:Transcript_9738/g.27534  ORF Transcript_9738/g.27534 Transcript_9738/m.27534 type:complete len:700 (+) Transcript_9738:111-2210(+)
MAKHGAAAIPAPCRALVVLALAGGFLVAPPPLSTRGRHKSMPAVLPSSPTLTVPGRSWLEPRHRHTPVLEATLAEGGEAGMDQSPTSEQLQRMRSARQRRGAGPRQRPAQSSRDLYLRAKQADKDNNLELSESLLLQLVEREPTNPRLWRRLARLSRELRGSVEESEARLRKGLELCPESAYLWQALGDLYKKRGEVAAARGYYRRSLQEDPTLVLTLHSWGRMEARESNLRTAYMLVHRGLDLEPTNSRLVVMGAALQDQLGQTQAAVDLLDRGLEANRIAEAGANSHPHLLYSRAMLHYQHGNVTEARSMLSELTARKPRFRKAWWALARLEEEKGTADWARRYYRMACEGRAPDVMKADARLRSPPPRRGQNAAFLGHVQEQSPAPASYWQSWARMEENQGEVLEAAAIYSKATKRFPEDPELWLNWAKLEYYRRENTVKAIELIQEAIDHCPTHTKVYQTAGELYSVMFRPDEARALFLKGLLTARPQDSNHRGDRDSALPPLLVSWATCEAQLANRPDRARKLFRWAVQTAMDDRQLGYVWHAFADFEMAQDRPFVAQHYVARSLQANPREPRVWKLWAQVCVHIGNEDLAQQCRERERVLVHEAEMAAMRDGWSSGTSRKTNPMRRRLKISPTMKLLPSLPMGYQESSAARSALTRDDLVLIENRFDKVARSTASLEDGPLEESPFATFMLNE